MTEEMAEAPGTSARSHPRRPVMVAFILFLVLADVALLGWVATRRRAVAANDPDAPLRGVMAVLHQQGLAAALDTLEHWAARDSAVLRGGHQIAHALGREAVAARSGNAAVIRECRPAFASGCYHGVVEASLWGGERVDVSRLQRLCVEAASSAGPGPGYECVHGLGHGVFGAVGSDIQAALHLCDALSTARLRASCHSGAFMEAISSALGASPLGEAQDHAHGSRHEHSDTTSQGLHSARRLSIDPADPYSPCGGFSDPHASSCWLFQGFVILRQHGFDAARALRVCDAAPDGRAARCYESVGHQLTGLFQHDDAWILEQCSRGRDDLAPWCAAGAALALDQLDWSGARAVRLCAAAPGAWKERCYRSASSALTDLAPASRRAQLCDSIEAAYARVCREASAPAEPGRPS